jgi:hypothetical protein
VNARGGTVALVRPLPAFALTTGLRSQQSCTLMAEPNVANEAEDQTPDSPLFLQIDAQGMATVWVEPAGLVTDNPPLCYRRDRCPEDGFAVSFHLLPATVEYFQVGFMISSS